MSRDIKSARGSHTWPYSAQPTEYLTQESSCKHEFHLFVSIKCCISHVLCESCYQHGICELALQTDKDEMRGSVLSELSPCEPLEWRGCAPTNRNPLWCQPYDPQICATLQYRHYSLDCRKSSYSDHLRNQRPISIEVADRCEARARVEKTQHALVAPWQHKEVVPQGSGTVPQHKPWLHRARTAAEWCIAGDAARARANAWAGFKI